MKRLTAWYKRQARATKTLIVLAAIIVILVIAGGVARLASPKHRATHPKYEVTASEAERHTGKSQERSPVERALEKAGEMEREAHERYEENLREEQENPTIKKAEQYVEELEEAVERGRRR